MSVVVKICGGLGNQMFQYAAGRALAVRCQSELFLDISWYASTNANTMRKYMLDVFPIAAKVYKNHKKSFLLNQQSYLLHCFQQLNIFKSLFHGNAIVFEPHYHYWNGFKNIHAPVYIEGFWQCEDYFRSIDNFIREEFRFPSQILNTAISVFNKICECENSISVHVRRGDYVSNSTTNAFHGCCSMDYYKAAIAYMKGHYSKAHLFIFSDDPDWVSSNFFTYGLPATFVNLATPEEPWRDCHLMSLCKHHIIANSSFSWWGAWLSGGSGLTVAPKLWFADPKMRDQSPCPKRWMLL